MNYLYNNTYKNAYPFPYMIIKDFFNQRDLMSCATSIKSGINNLPWKTQEKITNHQVKKRWIEDVALMPNPVKKIMWQLHSCEFLNFLRELTGINGIISDPSNLGGGMHCTSRGGKLNVHKDFNYSEETSLYRKINVLVFLNQPWLPEWGGNLEFWDKNLKSKVVEIPPLFNTMVIFNTDEDSLHGCPDPLNCPQDEHRLSLAAYYYIYSSPEQQKESRPFAEFHETN